MKTAWNVPDVLIVGAGGTGAVVAKELADAGLGVLVLETGPWHDPQRDFSGLEWDMVNPLDSVLRWGPADRTKPAWPRVLDGLAGAQQAPGVGGNTLRSASCSPRAFVPAIEYDWPVSYRALAPYYYKVEQTLPVSIPEVIARKDELFIAGCEAIGIEHVTGPDIRTSGWRMQPNAILPVAATGEAMRYPAIDGCTQCGECVIGCRNPEGAPLERLAKRSTNVSYAPAAHRTGRCEFRTGCFVTRVLTEEHEGGLRARAVHYTDARGKEFELEARAIVLCAGAIETPRLWMASSLPEVWAVGRYLTTHWFEYVSGVLPDEVKMHEGQTSMVRAEFPGYGSFESHGLGPMQYSWATMLGDADPGTIGPWARAGRLRGIELKRRMESYARTLMIAIAVDDESHPDNRVTLSPDVADEHNRAPVIRYHPTQRTIQRRDWLARRAAEVLIAAGAEPSSVHRAHARPTTINAHGTMRMGHDPARSVVDADGAAHTVEHLFIADTSVFPNSIGGPHPTLTAQAVASRIAERIVARCFTDG